MKQKRDEKGRFIKEGTDKVLFKLYLDYEDRDLLREEALKRQTTITEILRNLIKEFFKLKKR